MRTATGIIALGFFAKGIVAFGLLSYGLPIKRLLDEQVLTYLTWAKEI